VLGVLLVAKGAVDSGKGSPVGVEPILEGVDGWSLYHAVRQVVPGADHSLAEEIASDCQAAVMFC
jgi:hypothetical protein